MSKERTEVLPEFIKIIKDLVKDLVRTFPDKIRVDSEPNLLVLLNDEKDEMELLEKIYEFCKEVYPKKFFDILYENEELFEKDIELLPGVNFGELWKMEITDSIKSTIWKYLQLILFSVITNISSEESFGDTAKLFEAINQDEFKHKIEETLNEMEKIFNPIDMDNEERDISGSFKEATNLPNAEELHNHISQMMEGKLGCLAKEIAEETATDFSINVENPESVNDVFKQLFKNPGKLMDLVKNVGSKLDNKIKSGAIKESELLEEASELVNKMKNMPGMNNLESMFSKMGMPGMPKGGKVDMNALNRQMQQNLRAAKMRDRMRTKLEEKNKEVETERLYSQNYQDKDEENEGNIVSKGLNREGMEELVFSTGENVERSSRGPNKKKKKARGKKR